MQGPSSLVPGVGGQASMKEGVMSHSASSEVGIIRLGDACGPTVGRLWADWGQPNRIAGRLLSFRDSLFALFPLFAVLRFRFVSPQ